MTRIEFPNEPIRLPATPLVDVHEELGIEFGPDKAECWSCGGEGVFVCDGSVDCPEADDAGCPFVDFHTYRCDECNGRGCFDINLGKPL